MAKLIECDGCGSQSSDKSKIKDMRFAPTPGLGSPPQPVWRADLCEACVKRVSSPATWPRTPREGGGK